jgi:sodium/potassium-transporting ATPase subunit alpha
MDHEKDVSDEKSLPATTPGEEPGEALREKMTEEAAQDADQRIQFVPSAFPDRGRPEHKEGDISAYAAHHVRRSSRAQSIVSIPQVVSQTDKQRRKREKDEEKKHVDLDEHLMTHEEVAERYKTKINMDKPDDSLGLTGEQAAQLLEQHGLNILTPPSRRHPFLKYLDCLTSLFNLLLIFAGILEYILLGINFHDNFQNVSTFDQTYDLERGC